MPAKALLTARELLEGTGWVVDASWPDQPSEQLLGVFTSREGAAKWIEGDADYWRRTSRAT